VVHRVFTESDVLVLEMLNVSGMLKNHSLAKSISDASWSSFARKAVFKADSLGRHTVLVDPWGTTQCCHRCLHWVPKDIATREHVCPYCGETIPRDLNSALLIEAWHPESPARGQWVVTRRARASAIPHGDGKPER